MQLIIIYKQKKTTKMKQVILALATLFVVASAQAQKEKFYAAMGSSLAQLGPAFASTASLNELANKFERIGLAEKTEWLPFYYAAFCQVQQAFMEKDKTKTDGIADKATALLVKADSLMPNNSEISCLKSMIASAHMMVDPMSRWQQYGAESAAALEQAIAQDATNPRPYYLQGQGLKYTPEAFGGGCKTALPLFKTAAEKYAAFKAASQLHPTWGAEQNTALIAECQK
jgi:hypothetical protein